MHVLDCKLEGSFIFAVLRYIGIPVLPNIHPCRIDSPSTRVVSRVLHAFFEKPQNCKSLAIVEGLVLAAPIVVGPVPRSRTK